MNCAWYRDNNNDNYDNCVDDDNYADDKNYADEDNYADDYNYADDDNYADDGNYSDKNDSSDIPLFHVQLVMTIATTKKQIIDTILIRLWG